jgi:capsular polysaccharide biosynthesis protein
VEDAARAATSEGSADLLQDAGLGVNARIVDRKNAGAVVDARFGIAIAVCCVFFGALVSVSALVGAFDSRLHEPEDVSRLGLPVLGQVPDFPGQTVGSLEQRGVQRHRVPSFHRWRRS